MKKTLQWLTLLLFVEVAKITKQRDDLSVLRKLSANIAILLADSSLWPVAPWMTE